MSFRMQISPRSRKVARFVAGVHHQLQQAYARASRRGITQQDIAETLEVDRSVINRRLLGGGNLTMRTIADLAYALGEDVELTIRPRQILVGNYQIDDMVVTTPKGAQSVTALSAVSSPAVKRERAAVSAEYA